MQSVLFPICDRISEKPIEIEAYFKKLIDIAEYIGIQIIVFGSPKNRSVRCIEDEHIIFNFFIQIGDYCENKNVFVCIEPNAKEYGCNFLYNTPDTVRFINKINKKNIKLHLDTACMYLENEDILDTIIKNLDIVRHIHFSVPNLASLSSFGAINFAYLYNEIYKIAYAYKISIEMINQAVENIRKSIHCVLKTPNVSIIGAGWFGCHIASKILDKGYNITVYEKDEVFSGASGKNQNRLHMGFHYPRSYDTREMCFINYKKFINDYNFCVVDIVDNFYIISNESNIDYKTYTHIYRYENIPFEEVCNDLVECSQGVIKVGEKMIDNIVAKKYFEKILKTTLCYSYKTLKDLHSDYVLDLTNNYLATITSVGQLKVMYEITISFIYKTTNCTKAYTVIDGDFCSLYPYNLENNLYTLTCVKNTPIIKTNNIEVLKTYIIDLREVEYRKENMENCIKRYIPRFNSEFIFQTYFISYKCKFDNNADSRVPVIKRIHNIISIFCGKISGIYNVEQIV